MDKISFQKQILSQIGMADLANALIEFEEDRVAATTLTVYCLGSAILENAKEANALMLISQLLDGARIPPELLDILKNYTAIRKKISKDTWEYFYNYSFKDRIQTSFTVPNTMDPSAKALMCIIAENVLVDILTKPLNMLMGYIEHFARYWKQALDLLPLTYYLPKHHSGLSIHIEAYIASYYGVLKPFEVGVLPESSSIFYGYRFVGLVYKYPSDKIFQKVATAAARHQARSTMK